MKVGVIQEIDFSHGTIFVLDSDGQEFDVIWSGFLDAGYGTEITFE